MELTERDLCRWRLVEDFKKRLRQAAGTVPLHPSWSHPERLLHYSDYLSLFLLGVLNPVVRTMRGLCSLSRLKRVQQEICSRPVSLGSFSEAQAVLDPALLAEVFTQLSRELPTQNGQATPAGRKWLIQLASLFEGNPRMYWALRRRQGNG